MGLHLAYNVRLGYSLPRNGLHLSQSPNKYKGNTNTSNNYFTLF